MEYPRIIQGGMGVAVSSWPLARAVSSRGQLGVVSGTALDVVLARRLQLGDIGGHIAEAMNHFPIKEVAERVWHRYFVEGGKGEGVAFKSRPLAAVDSTKALIDLTVVASFVEVWLAKLGHSGMVGINLLEKIQLPTLPTLYGAMLAEVDVVLMGAGIPRAVPGLLDQMAAGHPVEMKIDVVGGDPVVTHFDPADYAPGPLKRPLFFAIVASASLAQVLAKKASPPVDGFIVEGPTAGGHNAPPRGQLQLNERGEPLYGERDLPDFAKYRELGLPFWLAGGYGTKERLDEALEVGAKGIQVGTAFAFCEESGIAPEIKAEVIQRSIGGTIEVFTDPSASPTGFPFKVVQLPGSVSDPLI
ncbi:MAG: nitronate monooxygenase, partial [Fimbriimonas sp.]